LVRPRWLEGLATHMQVMHSVDPSGPEREIPRLFVDGSRVGPHELPCLLELLGTARLLKIRVVAFRARVWSRGGESVNEQR
jgi:hypothetical protein